MPFDPHLVEANLALHRIGPEQMPNLACDAMEAGFDGPWIRRLAGLVNPSGWETDQILTKFMTEVGLQAISREEASLRLARALANTILSEGLDPLHFTREFESLWIDAGYPNILREAGCLDDEKAIAECSGESETELREHARDVLSALASRLEASQ